MTVTLSWTSTQHQLVHSHTFRISYLAKGYIKRIIIVTQTSSSRLRIFVRFIKKYFRLTMSFQSRNMLHLIIYT